MPNRPLVIAHRGASGYHVENSMAGFRRAKEMGADGVELDIHTTRDGRLVVHHDPVIAADGTIRDLPAVEVRKHRLLNGEPIPFLEEVLESLPGLSVWIEVKGLDRTWDQRLLDVIDSGPSPERYAVHSFDHEIIRRLHQLRPTLSLGALATEYPVDPVGPLDRCGADTLWQEWQVIDRRLVETVHRVNRRIIAWTVNQVELAKHLAGLGVDGLCGNYPDRLFPV